MNIPRFSLAMLCAAALAACASTRPAQQGQQKPPEPAPPVWPKIAVATARQKTFKSKNGQPLKSGAVFTSDSKVKRGTLVFFSTPYSGRFGLQYDTLLCQKMLADGWDVVWSQIDHRQLDFKATSSQETLPHIAEALARRIDASMMSEVTSAGFGVSLVGAMNESAKPRRPIVYFGISAGSFAVPALAARYGPPDAAILVCGTASVGDLLFTTGLIFARPDIRLANGRTPTTAERRELARLTRAATFLEPEKLAPFLQHTPTLLITAGQDLIVPTRLQDDLDAALGQPERWHYPGGHCLTYLRLPAQWPRISQWLERTVVLPSRQPGNQEPRVRKSR